MIDNPCYDRKTKTDCPERKAYCGVDCPKWKAYEEARAQEYARRKTESVVKDLLYSGAEKAMTKRDKYSIKQTRRGKKHHDL